MNIEDLVFDDDGNLDLSETKITSLPEGLEVGGWLDLSETKITSLPEGLEVGGWLDLYETEITSLPDGLKVGEWLNLYESNVTELSDDLVVEGRVFSDNKLICCEKLQIRLICSCEENFSIIKKPTDKAKRYHALKWKI